MTIDKISILIPFKNESKFLKKCIQSILNQSVSSIAVIEIIAVDDHSEDNSFEIINQLAKSDSRIKLFKNNGNGIITALQLAEQYITGNYITRQDADDLMPIDKLKIFLGILKNNGAGVITTGKVKYFSDELLGEGYLKYERWLNRLCDRDSHFDEIFKECVISSSNWMLSVKDFFKLKGYSDSFYPEDYHFVFKVYKAEFKVISSREITHLWRDHKMRASRNLTQYQDNHYFSLKVKYFKLFYKEKDICLWGAGPTGKKLAKVLLANDLTFLWVTNNKNKIGKKIYGIDLFNCNTLEQSKNNNLIVITVIHQKNSIEQIKSYLKQLKIKFVEY